MKLKWVVALAIGLLAVLAGRYVFQPSRTPAGQSALAVMNDGALAGLQAAFNRTAAKARVILLLSPT